MTKNIVDEIGPWSEIKLDILKKYATEYSKILAAQTRPKLKHVYIDAFAGGGIHLSRSRKEFVPGSPLNALNVKPPFVEYYFIDIESVKVEALRALAKEQPNLVHVYEGDCNELLINKVFPNVRYEDYKRGLCLLDPYGLHLNWEVIKTAGKMKSLEIFLNFPIADMNRNIFRRDPAKTEGTQIERMNRFWGDESWRTAAYSTERNLFGSFEEKRSNEIIAEAFRQRLKNVAGFSYVPKPMPMRNSIRATVYYLYFASPKPVAAKIVSYIFNKYRN